MTAVFKKFIAAMMMTGILAGSGLVLAESKSVLAQGFEEERVAPPVISVYPETISNTEVFYVGGAAEPLSTVFVFVEREGREVVTDQVRVSENGEWFYVYSRFLIDR